MESKVQPKTASDESKQAELPNSKKKSNHKKVKVEIFGVKTEQGGVAFHTEFDKQRMASIANDTPIKITVLSNPRNYAHHRKFFKLLSESFEYWQPTFKVNSEAEEWLMNEYQHIVSDGLNQYLTDPYAKEVINQFLIKAKEKTLERLKQHRESRLDYEGMKTLMGYLEHVMIQAGCYDIKPSMTGGTLKERWSISFDNMPQDVFNDVYKRCFGVIWNETMKDVFATEEELENRINMLMDFA